MHIYEVIKRPLLTEKSNYQSDALNRYTFEVDRRATKTQIAEAVAAVFDVSVERVNVMNVRGKKRRYGRHVGKRPDWKKAIVALAPGDSIGFFEGV